MNKISNFHSNLSNTINQNYEHKYDGTKAK